ncbi:MAG: hypothetical protein ACE37D_22280 [Pseudomonadales bacterium]
MDFANLIRTCVIFLVLATTLATNMDDNLLARLGMDSNFAYVLGFAALFSVLLSERNAFIVAAVVMFSLNANMPIDFSLNLGVDRDYYAGLMFALLLQPVMVRTMSLG